MILQQLAENEMTNGRGMHGNKYQINLYVIMCGYAISQLFSRLFVAPNKTTGKIPMFEKQAIYSSI